MYLDFSLDELLNFRKYYFFMLKILFWKILKSKQVIYLNIKDNNGMMINMINYQMVYIQIIFFINYIF